MSDSWVLDSTASWFSAWFSAWFSVWFSAWFGAKFSQYLSTWRSYLLCIKFFIHFSINFRRSARIILICVLLGTQHICTFVNHFLPPLHLMSPTNYAFKKSSGTTIWNNLENNVENWLSRGRFQHSTHGSKIYKLAFPVHLWGKTDKECHFWTSFSRVFESTSLNHIFIRVSERLKVNHIFILHLKFESGERFWPNSRKSFNSCSKLVFCQWKYNDSRELCNRWSSRELVPENAWL